MRILLHVSFDTWLSAVAQYVKAPIHTLDPQVIHSPDPYPGSIPTPP